MRDQEQEVLGRAEADPGGVAPASPGLAAAERCFEIGDFREARRLAGEAIRSDDAAARAAAQGLLDRLAPDPAARWVAIGCLLLFALVVWLTLLR